MKTDGLWCDVQCAVICGAGCTATEELGSVFAAGAGIESNFNG